MGGYSLIGRFCRKIRTTGFGVGYLRVSARQNAPAVSPSPIFDPVVEARILVVEDDLTIATNLVRALHGHGYRAEHAATGAGAVARSGDCDLVILDLGLPDIDGLDVCRQLRAAAPDLPVIMLTARQTEIDMVVGLDAGAVDYVTKPFRLAELLARVRAHLRTAGPQGGDQLHAGPLRIDFGARRAWWGDDELELRSKEFDLLSILAREAGRVVTRERLMAEVWDEHWFGSTKTLDVHVAALRRRLGEAPRAGNDGEPSAITTLRGVGYRLDLP
jgi:DNA-binding response OmpR family regulator